MKAVLFIFTLNTIGILAHSQNCSKELNRNFIIKVISRTSRSPESIDCNKTGITLLKIFTENDSIKIKSLYSSCSTYDFSTDNFLLKSLNKYCKDSIPEACAIVIPMYYYYMSDSGELEKPEQWKFSAMKNKMEHLNKKDLIIFDPIEWTLYPPHVDKIEPYIVPIRADSTIN